MTRDNPTRAERIGLYLPCPKCKAKPGEWCWTNGDHPIPAKALHLNRVQPACVIYDMGVVSGKRVFA